MAGRKPPEKSSQLKKELRLLLQEVPPGEAAPDFLLRLLQIAKAQGKELSRISTRFRRALVELEEWKARSAVTVHDLKVPVTISLLNLELAEMETDEQEQANYIISVRRELEFLLDTIGNMLELQQTVNGTTKLKIQEVPLYPLVEGVIERMRVVIRDKPELKIRNDVPPEFPPLHADRHKLTRVYNNLLSNAIKYTSTGAITVGSSLPQGNSGIRLFVQDTGDGIEPDRLPQMFQFFQGDETRLESSGVGLAFVKQVIQAHGGKVWLESTRGKGTTVFMEIPETIGKVG